MANAQHRTEIERGSDRLFFCGGHGEYRVSLSQGMSEVDRTQAP
ncbi:MAG TPA: hypothetical protein V6C85_28540 [Allocoleopsis sp.]